MPGRSSLSLSLYLFFTLSLSIYIYILYLQRPAARQRVCLERIHERVCGPGLHRADDRVAEERLAKQSYSTSNIKQGFIILDSRCALQKRGSDACEKGERRYSVMYRMRFTDQPILAHKRVHGRINLRARHRPIKPVQ